MIPRENTFPLWRKAFLGLSLLAVLAGGTLCYEKALGQEQGGRTPTSASPTPLLTEEERTWLREHPVIRVAQDPGWPPVEFADDRGEPSGISNDYLNLIEQRLGITFERVRNLSWQEAYDRLKRWDIDMTTSVAVTPERTEFWAFTKPYLTIPIVTLANADVTYIAAMRELEGKKVGVVDGYVSNEWIRRDFPNIHLVKVRTVKEGLDLLQKGEVFAFVDNMLVIGYYMAKLKLVNFKIAGGTPYVNAQCMAVRKDWAILAGILQKALDSISETERERIYHKWVPIRYEHGFDYQLLWKALAIFAVILGGLLVWNRKLSREIRYRKEAETALKKSELRFRSYVENAADIVYGLTPDGIFTYVSPNWLDLMGEPSTEAVGKSFESYVHPDDVPLRKKFLEKVLRSGTSLTSDDYRALHRDGSWRWYVSKGSPLYDDDGKPVGFIGIARDITERKRAEESLRESERRYRDLWEKAPVMMISLDPNGRMVSVSDLFLQVLGYERDEVLGRTSFQFQTEESRLHATEFAFPTFMKTGLLKDVPLQFVKKNGEVIDVLLSATAERDAQGRIVRSRSVFIDVTEKKLAEKELRDSEEKFSKAFQNSPDAITITKVADGTLIDVNDAFVRISGYSREEALGRTSLELELWANPEDRDRYVAALKERARVLGFEASYKTKSDETRICLVSGEFIEMQGERCILGVIHDITGRKRSEEELRRANRALMTLSECNQALVRAADEGQLLNDACRIIVDFSGYRFAWIGLVEFDETQRVRPVAHAGYEQGYLGSLDVAWADREEGWGPTGSAIRTGQPIIAHDIATQPHYDLWREEALKRGFVSSIALPLKENGRVFAALTIYSAEFEAFHQEELRLLMELAEDISFGISSLRTKQKLEASELKYRELVEHANSIILKWSPDGRITFVNEFAERFFGYDKEELLGRPAVGTIVPETETTGRDLSNLVEDIVNNPGRYVNNENENIRRNGERVWVAWTNKPVLGEDGRIEEFLSIGNDVTEQRRLEKELLKEKDLNDAMIDGLPGAFYVFDSDGKFLRWNKNFEKIAGRSAEEISGMQPLDFVSDEHKISVARTIEKVLAAARTVSIEADFLSKDGIKTPFLFSGKMIRLDETPCIIGMGIDISARRQMEQALRQSEERLRLALIASQQGFYDLNVVTGEAVVSPEYAAILGYEPSEFQETNEQWIERLHPDDRDRVAAFYRSYIAGEVENYQVEFRQRTKSGDWKWILSLGKVVARNPDGSPLRMVGTHLDITPRKLAEKDLQEKTELIRSVFQASPLAMIALDREGIVTLWNPAAERMFGWTEKEALGSLNPIVPEQKLDEFRRLQEILFRGESFSGLELTRRKKDGMAIEISLSTAPLTGLDGKIVGNLAVIADITSRKRSEAAQRRLATAIEQSIESIMMTDRAGKIIYVNPAFEKISGYEKEEVIGRNTRFLKSDRHDSSHYKDLVSAIKNGNSWKGRLVSQGKDGKLIYEDVSISPVRDSSGEIVGFVDVAHDVTEHIELEKQLIQAQKMEAVGTLAGGIAHDFNNLLQVVLGYSELMLMDTKLDSRVRDDLGKMNQAARTGADLVQSLLTFSRKTESKPRPLNLNHQIERLKKLLSRTVPKMIEIQLNLDGDAAAISADPTQIEQVMMNLAINARDAMPDGGKLLIETQNATLDKDYCGMHLGATPGDHVLLQFSDTGKGMDRDTLEHIFEPFYTTKGPGEGTGLGLAMVYGIVKQHGGHVMCYSELGQGTTFKIFFPALPADSQVERAPLKPRLQGGTETILLVDDEVLIRDLGKRMLNRAGYTVVTAANGHEALEVYRNRRNDIALVILDLIMPEMGGKQCLEEILKINPGAAVIVASGYSAQGPTKEALEGGAKGFVSKPFDMGRLLQTVRRILDER